MDLLADLLPAELGLPGRAGGDPRQVLPHQPEGGPGGERLERQEDLAAGPLLDRAQQRQVPLERGQVDHERRGLDPGRVDPAHPSYRSSTCQGSPRGPSCSRNGAGSSCSTLNTPAPFHCPVAIRIAPTVAGTPVV